MGNARSDSFCVEMGARASRRMESVVMAVWFQAD